MTVDTDWENLIKGEVGAVSHYRALETASPFVDVIGGKNIAYTSGITTGQATPLVGNSTDKSILGTATVVIGQSANLSLTGGDFLSAWCVGCMVKHSGAPGTNLAMWALGNYSVARKNLFMYMSSTLLRAQSAGWANYDAVLHSSSNLTDGNWHLVLLNCDSTKSPVSDRLMYSIGGGAFTSFSGGGNFLPLTSTDTTFTLLNNGNSAYDGNGVGLDEIFVVPNTLSDIMAARINSKALVLGYPQGKVLSMGAVA